MGSRSGQREGAQRVLDQLAAHLRDGAARPSFVDASRRLHVTFRLAVDTTSLTCVVDAGELTTLPAGVDQPVDFTIAGPAAEWLRLISGAADLAQATNLVHGRLTISGSSTKAAACNYLLYNLLSRPRVLVDRTSSEVP